MQPILTPILRAMGFAAVVLARFARGAPQENGLFIFEPVSTSKKGSDPSFIGKMRPHPPFDSYKVGYWDLFWARGGPGTIPECGECHGDSPGINIVPIHWNRTDFPIKML